MYRAHHLSHDLHPLDYLNSLQFWFDERNNLCKYQFSILAYSAKACLFSRMIRRKKCVYNLHTKYGRLSYHFLNGKRESAHANITWFSHTTHIHTATREKLKENEKYVYPG